MEFLLRLYLNPPAPPSTLRCFFLLKFFCAVSTICLSKLFKTAPPTPRGLFAQAILFRIKGVLAQDHILPSDT